MVSISSNISLTPANLSRKLGLAGSNAAGGTLDSSGNSNPLVALLATSALSNDRPAKPLSDQQRKANDVIDTLNQAKKSLVTDRKAAATRKLDLARRKLQILRAFGGDPKAIARQAKQIAQEIREAAREYGSALKSEGQGGTLDIAGQPAEALTSDDSATPLANASVATDQGAQATAITSPETPTADTSSAPSPEAKPPADATQAPATADAETARQKTLQASQDLAAKAAAQSNKAQDEQKVLEKFKDAAREAKRLIEEAARKLKAKNPADPDAADAERAQARLDQEIQNLGDTIQAQQSEVSAVTVGIAVVSPAINILA